MTKWDLHWQSLTPTSTDYTVFVHVIRPDGAPIAQQDHPPLHGFAHTRTWQSGQPIADQFDIPLPDELSPSEYEVRVGMYTLDGGRLVVTEDGQTTGDYAAVGSFAIE